MYSTGIQLNAASYSNMFSVAPSSSLAVPVKPGALIYSQFNYVRGTVASQGQRTVSIAKVKILNTLISQLVAMRQKPGVSKDETAELSEEQTDALIKQYQKQIQTAVASAQKAGFGLAGAMPIAGDAVSVMA